MSDNVRLQAWQLQNLLQAFVQNATSHPLAHIERSIQKSRELIEVLRHDLNLDAFKRRKLRSSLTVRQFQSRCAKLRHKCKKLQAEVDLIKGEKLAGRVQHVWCIRAGLAPPNIPPQSLSELCKDFGVEEAKVLSRTYITQVRDAFTEMIKRGNVAELTFEASTIWQSQSGKAPAIIVSHLHDEASLKLRSFDSELVGRTLRARYSKVQNEVVRVKFPSGKTIEYFTELQPLLKKDSDTIGQAIVNTAKNVIVSLLDQPATRPPQPLRLIYILTGDGINTNLASAKKMFSFFAQNASYHGTRVDLRLWCVRCASHVANLVVLVALVGEIISAPVDNSDLCAALVRWYKYIVPQYVEELNSSLRSFLLSNFRVQVGDPNDCNLHEPNLRQKSLDLQRLYGRDTLPDELLQLFNRGLGVWAHVSRNVGEEHSCLQEAFRLLSHLVLFLQERPQPTRFWHFAACARALLRMRMIGITKEVLQVTTTRPSAENADRLTKFWAFYDTPAADLKLRTAVLCLSLTEHALSISSSKTTDRTSAPTLVRLAQGEVQDKTLLQLNDLLGLLRLDESLDLLETTTALLVTEIHLLVRYDDYYQFPYRIFELTRKFNPTGHLAAIESFLDMEQASLDLGYSFPLQQEAWKQGSAGSRELSSAIAFLLRDDIQQEMVNALEHASASSLDVERSHVQVKRNEQNKVLSVAVASRNRILARPDSY